MGRAQRGVRQRMRVAQGGTRTAYRDDRRRLPVTHPRLPLGTKPVHARAEWTQLCANLSSLPSELSFTASAPRPQPADRRVAGPGQAPERRRPIPGGSAKQKCLVCSTTPRRTGGIGTARDGWRRLQGGSPLSGAATQRPGAEGPGHLASPRPGSCDSERASGSAAVRVSPGAPRRRRTGARSAWVPAGSAGVPGRPRER